MDAVEFLEEQLEKAKEKALQEQIEKYDGKVINGFRIRIRTSKERGKITKYWHAQRNQKDKGGRKQFRSKDIKIILEKIKNS